MPPQQPSRHKSLWPVSSRCPLRIGWLLQATLAPLAVKGERKSTDAQGGMLIVEYCRVCANAQAVDLMQP